MADDLKARVRNAVNWREPYVETELASDLVDQLDAADDQVAKLWGAVLRIEAMHTVSYRSVSDEVYHSNPQCSCGGAWPCATTEALRMS